MKLKFDANQQYQLDTIDAVVDIFAGRPYVDSSIVGGQQAPEQSENKFQDGFEIKPSATKYRSFEIEK